MGYLLNMFKIEIKGTDLAIASLKNKQKGFDNTVKLAVRASGIQVERQAKMNAPAKTGSLRRSILSVEENNGMTARVGPDMAVAPYAVFVEQGHSQQPGRYVPAIGKRLVASWVNGKFYMMTTFVQMRQKVADNIKRAIELSINK